MGERDPEMPERPEEMRPILLKLKAILADLYPNISTDVLIEDQPILFIDSVTLDQLCRLGGGVSGYTLKKMRESETWLNHCVEVETPDGHIVYLVGDSEHEKVLRDGFHVGRYTGMISKIRSYIERYISAEGGEDFTKEQCAKIILGKLECILPVIAGIKPAAVVSDSSRELVEALGLKVLASVPNFIIYHPIAVTETVKRYHDIFAAAGIPESMDAAEVIQQTLGRKDALSEINLSNKTPALRESIGLILGFDRTSVQDFITGKSQHSNPSFHLYNIWEVVYKVSRQESNEDFQILKHQYDELRGKIESLLSDNDDPLEVLLKIAKESGLETGENIHIVRKVSERTTKKIDEILWTWSSS